jgi:hypothetical protein
VNRKRKSDNLENDTKVYNGITYENPGKIANKFAEHFALVFSPDTTRIRKGMN